MADKTGKPTTVLEIGEGEDTKELSFTVTREAYVAFTNEMAGPKKYAAMFNFLMACIAKEHKECLGEIFKDNPQCVTDYCGLVIEDYKPDTAVIVKKRNGLLID